MKQYRFLLLIALISLSACKGDDDSPPPTPVATQLIFPEENSECTSGVDVNATQSRINFSWEEAANTDTYELNVTNLLTGFSDEYTTASTSFEVTLQKGEPYSWSVRSLSETSSQTAQSATWSFYNAGDGVESYAPFPAGLVYPDMGARVFASEGNLTLQWNGADVDNDISAFTLYFDTVSPPVAILGNSISSGSFQVSGLVASTVYYWQIITTDLEGNTSSSGIFEFRTAD